MAAGEALGHPTPQNQCDLSLTLADANGAELDTAFPVRFGFRELWIDGRDFRLNGSRICLSSTPLDNAQTGAASAQLCSDQGDPPAPQELRHQLRLHAQLRLRARDAPELRGGPPGRRRQGMLVAFSQPHFANTSGSSADADAANGYAQHADFYVRVAQNHPSVVFIPPATTPPATPRT